MRLIDADKLYPDSVSIKGDRLCISQSQIANAPTVDVLEQIRKEIEHEADYQDAYVDADVAKGMYMALEIIDKHCGKEKE